MGDPEEEELGAIHARFRIGDVFPAEDPVARWAIRLAAVLNDLVRAQGDLLQPGLTGGDLLWRARIVGSVVHEGARFVRRSIVQSDVWAFVRNVCPAEALWRWRAIDRVTNPCLGVRGKQIARARHKTFHYETESEKTVRQVLASLADHEGEIAETGKLVGLRVVAADEYSLRMARGLVPTPPADQHAPDPFERLLLDSIREAALGMTEFCRVCLIAYLKDPTRSGSMRLSLVSLERGGEGST